MDEPKVRAWMRRNQAEFVDDCGEVNCTRLAEAAAEHFHLCADDSEATIPEEVFDLAFEVSEEKE